MLLGITLDHTKNIKKGASRGIHQKVGKTATSPKSLYVKLGMKLNPEFLLIAVLSLFECVWMGIQQYRCLRYKLLYCLLVCVWMGKVPCDTERFWVVERREKSYPNTVHYHLFNQYHTFRLCHVRHVFSHPFTELPWCAPPPTSLLKPLVW